MPITPQNGFSTAGVAGKYEETINPANLSFLASEHPAPIDRTHLVLTNQQLEALTVVGLDANGKVVPANNTTVPAVGVLVYPVDSTGADVEAQVYRTGNFVMNELVWPAAYDTDAKKIAAFDGAPAPTHIFVTPTQTLVPSS